MGASVFGKAKNDCSLESGDLYVCKPSKGFMVTPWRRHGCKAPSEYKVENINNHSVVTLNNAIFTFSTIISLSLGNK